MEKIKLGPTALIYPIPIVLCGAMVKGKPNWATIGDCGIMGLKPPLVYVSLNKNHHTTSGIIESNGFSINIPSTALLAETDYCGMVSGRDADKSTLFEYFFGESGNIPMISGCPVNLECRIVKDFLIEHRHIFIGEVIQTHVSDEYVIEASGRLMPTGIDKLDPIIYSLDNKYHKIGPAIGTGYKEGESFRKNDSV
jgi:flavin reductase (DIM6/NTAB) family NADH-FMN oxidoreductase RutF